MANSTAAKAIPKVKSEGFFAKIGKFIRESYIETRYKSAWPTWMELRTFTIVVIFAVLVVAVWIGGIDFLLGRLTHYLQR